MSEGEKKKSAKERIIRLFMQGSISSEDFESMIKELAESSMDADVEERLPSLSGEYPSAPEMDKKAAAYVRVSSSGQGTGTSLEAQEGACADLAKSMGHCLDEANVRRYVETGGGANE